jgi:dienelactone hydrolase
MDCIKRNFSYLIILLLMLFSGRGFAQEIVMVPVSIDGKTVRLEMIIYKPEGTVSPLPTVVLNHGSTGYGRNPSTFKAKIDYFDNIIEYFSDRGWAVIVPMRRGRGGSDGVYDEGFYDNRSYGYTCETSRSLKGADRALADIDASMRAIIAMPFVDKDRVIIGGVSRGGILSTAYAGIHPENINGVINFVGGWMGDGCSTAETINGELFRMGSRATVSSIWLYGDNDPFYSLAHSKGNFQEYLSAGGKGEFHEIELSEGINGHTISSFPKKWSLLVDSYLKSRRL